MPSTRFQATYIMARTPEEQQKLQQEFERHAYEFPVNLKFPANIVPKDASKSLRTNNDLIQIRLLEAGVTYEDPQPVAHTVEKLGKFVNNLEQSGCFESVHVQIEQVSPPEEQDNDESSSSKPQRRQPQQQNKQQPTQELNVILNEKKWYRLYVGGGIRNDMQGDLGIQDGYNLLAKTQFETSAGLNNVTGHLDTTALQYTLDATSNSRWDFRHDRPLDSVAPTILQYYLDNVGQYSLGFHAVLDTLDYEWTRSYKERQRKVSLRLSNLGQLQNPEMAPSSYIGCEWSWMFRDLIPRRHGTLPFALDTSPEVASQSGPSEKNSITVEVRSNGTYCDSKFNPTAGIDYYSKLEIAGPPGDVGFAKAQGGGCLHIPLFPSVLSCSLHGSFHTGVLESFSFGGACRPASISDRFFVGGPLQLRGFSPAGIGPRAQKGSETCPQGDALGGDFFYTATLATSMTTDYLAKYGIRFLAFGNTGTLVGSIASAPTWTSIAKSSRASVGLGASVALPMGRFEATYAWPLRFGPRDVRKNVQFGIGFNFG